MLLAIETDNYTYRPTIQAQLPFKPEEADYALNFSWHSAKSSPTVNEADLLEDVSLMARSLSENREILARLAE